MAKKKLDLGPTVKMTKDGAVEKTSVLPIRTCGSPFMPTDVGKIGTTKGMVVTKASWSWRGPRPMHLAIPSVREVSLYEGTDAKAATALYDGNLIGSPSKRGRDGMKLGEIKMRTGLEKGRKASFSSVGLGISPLTLKSATPSVVQSRIPKMMPDQEGSDE